MTDFERAYNRIMAGRPVDTKLMADCELLWDVAIASVSPERLAERDARLRLIAAEIRRDFGFDEPAGRNE